MAALVKSGLETAGLKMAPSAIDVLPVRTPRPAENEMQFGGTVLSRRQAGAERLGQSIFREAAHSCGRGRIISASLTSGSSSIISITMAATARTRCFFLAAAAPAHASSPP